MYFIELYKVYRVEFFISFISLHVCLEISLLLFLPWLGLSTGVPSFRESEKLIIYLFIYALRFCELERDLSSYAVLGYTRTVGWFGGWGK